MRKELKRLTVNRETLRFLDDAALRQAAGQITPTQFCFTAGPTICVSVCVRCPD
jgi:hypothetical protein